MDPRAITLAQLEFKAFNDQVRVRPRSRFTSGRPRSVTIPSLLTGRWRAAWLQYSPQRPPRGCAWLAVSVGGPSDAPDRSRERIRGLGRDQAMSDGPRGHLRPRFEPELSENILDVTLGGVDGDGQFGRDLGVTQPARKEHRHFVLAV